MTRFPRTHTPRTRLGILAATTACALTLAACSFPATGSTTPSSDTPSNDTPGGDTSGDDAADPHESTRLEIAAVMSPMTDVVEAAGEAIKDGYEIELVEVSDYVTANVIVSDGDVYGNFSQHEPYMETFNAGAGGSLVAVQPVYNFVIAFYSKTIEDIAELPEGAVIAIADDASNRGRALKLLADASVITLDPGIDPYEAEVSDIIENPKDAEFLEAGISALNAAYDEADLVYQWPSHIAALGLTPEDDGLITELDDAFALHLAVREEDADSEATAALRGAFSSDAVREVIETSGTLKVAF